MKRSQTVFSNEKEKKSIHFVLLLSFFVVVSKFFVLVVSTKAIASTLQISLVLIHSMPYNIYINIICSSVRTLTRNSSKVCLPMAKHWEQSDADIND